MIKLTPDCVKIVYSLEREAVAAEIPVWGDAQNVTVSRDGQFALVSYGSTAPPELWRIEITKDGSVDLDLCRMYSPATGSGDEGVACDLVGHARFG